MAPTMTSFLLVAASLACVGLFQGVDARDLPEPPALDNQGRGLLDVQHGRELLDGPQAAGCAAAGLSCCYSPTWWLQQQVKPSVRCLSGTQNSVTAEALLQAVQSGSIGASNTPCSYLQGCTSTAVNVKSADYYENIGDYTGSYPCSTNTFNGQTITVYEPANLKGNNNEVVWEDASVPSGQASGVQACNLAQGASYTLTATYSKSSSWNIGVQLGAKILKDYEAKLTAGYSETYTRGTNAGVTVTAKQGEHATVTSGTLVHHALGWWDVKFVVPYQGCSEYRIDNVAADLVAPTSDPNFPTDWGVESKPCGYPLLNGKLS